VYILGADKDI